MSQSKNTRANTAANSAYKIDEDMVVMPIKDIEAMITKIIKNQLDDLKQSFADQLAALTTRFKDIESHLNTQTEKVIRLENEIDIMKTQIAKTDGGVLEAVKKSSRDAVVIANDAEQYTRRNNIRIRGLTLKPQVPPSVQISSWINTRLKLTSIKPEDIEIAHTLPILNRPVLDAASHSAPIPPIIVRFLNRNIRDKVISQRKLLKGAGIIISEDLTTLNMELINRMKNDIRVNSTWAWQGKVFIKLVDSNIIKKIKPYESIDDLVNNKNRH